MKKKYFAPEMDELELDEPFVLSDQEGTNEEDPIVECNPEEEA